MKIGEAGQEMRKQDERQNDVARWLRCVKSENSEGGTRNEGKG